MKLFVIAALVAVAAAARLEHLEHAYLPPFGNNVGFGSPSSLGSFGANSGSFGAGLGRDARGHFAGATSNQYLPPDHGPSGNNGLPQFAGSLQGFGGQQNYRSQQYAAPSSQYSPQAGSSFGAPSYQQFGQQPAAASRQYLAPHIGSYQEPPQQAFDEQTGYHY